MSQNQPSQSPTQQHEEPNLFELSNSEIQITYSSTSLTSSSQLNYNTNADAVTFKDEDIRVEKSELGTLVHVSTIKTVDTGYSTLTLFIPRVNLAGSSQQNISTIAIFTQHLFGVLPHPGAQELYSVQSVDGVARFVES